MTAIARARAASAAGIHLVGASAGSGKTTRLTRAVVAALDPACPSRIPIDRLAAVTYTRKAAAELAARIHRSLLTAGSAAEAARLPLAHVGTVHAVCLRLLEEHSIDAGLSPHVEVLAGDQARVLRKAMERCIPVELRVRMADLARRLQIFWDARVQRSDWLRPVSDIIELARANRIRPDALEAMGIRSAESLLALLPAPAPSGDVLDQALASELERALHALTRSSDSTATTAKVKLEVARALRRAQSGLPWSDWVKLSKLEPAKASIADLAPLVQAAAEVERHPRLRQDLADFTAGVFEAARAGLDGYAHWKAEWSLVDYTDMIDLGLALAEDPAASLELARGFELLVVDEFQDTSPLQLALFTRLHRLGARCVLVGDPKQCIFEYAGADPLLMEATARWVRGSGGSTETLPANYRSRPALVKAANHIFGPAFARFGVAMSEVEVAAERTDSPEQEDLPPFGVFWLESKKAEQDAAAIAGGVARLLARSAAMPILCPASGTVRPVRAGDVAILTATNAEAEQIANALEQRRIGAALARPGLLTTPEGTLLEAALRWLLDPMDALAGAILDALTGWAGRDPDVYLAERIAACHPEGEAAQARDASALGPWREPLELVRRRLEHLSPSEAVLDAIVALDATTLCARWPEPEQRLGNLDALFALAVDYEDRAARRREPVTLVGLLADLADAKAPVLTRDGERASDEQHVRGADGAVTVSTYHRAKGLEWPVVVLGSLDRKERRSAFDVTPESDRPAFDPSDPLGGRWIRYWPWPFGAQRTAPLATAATGSPVGRRVGDREDRERVRLLYVGFTRARDHLILALRRTKGKPHAAWLDELAAAAGNPLLTLPVKATDDALDAIRIGSSFSVPARISVLAPREAAPIAIRPPARRFARRLEAATDERPGYRIAPSRADVEWPDIGTAHIGRIVSIAPRVALRRTSAIDWELAGRAIHGFFAADPGGLAPDQRLERAAALLTRDSLIDHVDPHWLLAASDALRTFIASRWPGASVHHEIPLTAFLRTPHGRRRIEGTIDLLVDAGASVAIIDHKSFPAWSEGACRVKAAELAPQLLAYARGLALLGRHVDSMWFHFPLAGLVAEVVPERGRA